MALTDWMKSKNRTLLEMYSGMLVYALLCQIIGCFFPSYLAKYSVALWFGVCIAGFALLHMYRTLDRALDFPEKEASKKIFVGYMIRYGVFILALVLAAMTDYMHPLVVFLGYMSLKVAAFVQPFTHKLYNALFHETDPVAQPMPEEENSQNSDSV